jgi:hypothetical protein
MGNFKLKNIGKKSTDVDASIELHKLIDSGDEQGAINLIKTNRNIDVSYVYKERLPVMSAANNGMYDLFEVIVNHPTFDSSIEDGFGETLLISLMYMYGSDEILNDKENEKECEKMINAILKSDVYDFNVKDLTNDTAINIACEYPKMLWIVEALASKKEVDINIVNCFECAALGSCIRNKNLEALKIIAKRRDLMVTANDLKLADRYGIDLSEYGIEISEKLKKEVSS